MCCLGANALLFMVRYLNSSSYHFFEFFFSFVVRLLTPQPWLIVTQLQLLKVSIIKQYETGRNILLMII